MFEVQCSAWQQLCRHPITLLPTSQYSGEFANVHAVRKLHFTHRQQGIVIDSALGSRRLWRIPVIEANESSPTLLYFSCYFLSHDGTSHRSADGTQVTVGPWLVAARDIGVGGRVQCTPCISYRRPRWLAVRRDSMITEAVFSPCPLVGRSGRLRVCSPASWHRELPILNQRALLLTR